jgi:potassium-transporting ATPase KdpC subunit
MKGIIQNRLISLMEHLMIKELRPAIFLFVVLTLICGGIYPLAVTGIASIVFPGQAKGSFIVAHDNRVAGSILIGQAFTDARYFWPRPSATAGFRYNPLASGGSNLGPTNPELLKIVRERIEVLRNSGVKGNIPADLVEASASGLDPDISPEAALLQVPRVAKARGISEIKVKQLVASHIEDRQWGIFGRPRVNVLRLNLALDGTR